MQATFAVRERLLPLCLSISAFRVEGQMVKNNFLAIPRTLPRGSSLPATKKVDRNRSLPCSPAWQSPTVFSSAAGEATVQTPGWCWQRELPRGLLAGSRRRCWFDSSAALGDKEEPTSSWCGGSWCPSPDSQSASSLRNPAHWSRSLWGRRHTRNKYSPACAILP